MKIWLDADDCPRVIKEIIFRASERLRLPVLLVANKSLSKHDSELIESIVVVVDRKGSATFIGRVFDHSSGTSTQNFTFRQKTIP